MSLHNSLTLLISATKLYVHFNRKIDTIECSCKMGIEPLNHLELPKPVDNLKPLETIWNQLKPPETFQKVPETTWNRLKSATLYYLFYLRYSQVVLVLILHPKVFFGQNLKFSKLTEIWYRGTLLYAHYDFNIYFSKVFVTYVFCANLVSWSAFLQID